jgi:hypothetical protein
MTFELDVFSPKMNLCSAFPSEGHMKIPGGFEAFWTKISFILSPPKKDYMDFSLQ